MFVLHIFCRFCGHWCCHLKEPCWPMRVYVKSCWAASGFVLSLDSQVSGQSLCFMVIICLCFIVILHCLIMYSGYKHIYTHTHSVFLLLKAYIMKLLEVYTIWHWILGWLVNSELERMWKEAGCGVICAASIMAIALEGLNITMHIIIPNSQFLSWDFNPGHTTYEAGCTCLTIMFSDKYHPTVTFLHLQIMLLTLFHTAVSVLIVILGVGVLRASASVCWTLPQGHGAGALFQTTTVPWGSTHSSQH